MVKNRINFFIRTKATVNRIISQRAKKEQRTIITMSDSNSLSHVSTRSGINMMPALAILILRTMSELQAVYPVEGGVTRTCAYSKLSYIRHLVKAPRNFITLFNDWLIDHSKLLPEAPISVIVQPFSCFTLCQQIQSILLGCAGCCSRMRVEPSGLSSAILQKHHKIFIMTINLNSNHLLILYYTAAHASTLSRVGTIHYAPFGDAHYSSDHHACVAHARWTDHDVYPTFNGKIIQLYHYNKFIHHFVRYQSLHEITSLTLSHIENHFSG